MSLEDRLYPLLNLWHELPPGAQRAVGFGYRLLPRAWRWGRHYAGFRDLASASAQWSFEELRGYQFKQLRRTLIQAANYSPYYQRRFAEAGFRPELMKDCDGLAECPFLTKRELRQHRESMVSRDLPRSRRLYLTTGGSTGEPVGFYLHQGISRPKEQAFLEAQWRRSGYTEGARLAVIRGHVTTAQSEGRIAVYDPTRDWLLLSSSHLTEERLPEYLESIERFRPDLLHAYPSAALQLARFLERAGQSWRTPLQAVLCGSERLTVPQKRLLERVFGCRVYRWYGHAERVVLAGEGARSDLFYFWPSYGYVEFGPPDAAGFCEVIGTSFHNLVLPLIRYRTGDLVKLADPRSDGELEFPWPAVSDIAGREQEFLVSAGGRRISLTAFNMHDAIFDGLYAVQLFQETPGHAEFRFVPAPEFHRSRLDEMARGIQRKLGDDFTVEFREVAETEKTSRGKHRWLVSRLPQE